MKLSPYQYFALCLISIQERAHKHKLSSMFNTNSTPKLKKLKTSFI